MSGEVHRDFFMELAGLRLDSELEGAGVRHLVAACTAVSVGTVSASRAVTIPSVAQRKHVIAARTVEHGLAAMQEQQQ